MYFGIYVQKLNAITFLRSLFLNSNEQCNIRNSTCCWLNHVQTRRKMYFLCAANVLLKEFICLHSHGVLLLSIMFMASFALAYAAPSPSSFSACAKEKNKEREREKTTASNCIDQHQPLFLLFIFDFVRLCRWFFGS